MTKNGAGLTAGAVFVKGRAYGVRQALDETACAFN